MLPVAILAGGLATRLRPITESIPKALIEVAGRPFIFHQLDYLSKQGINSVVLCVGHLGDMIRDVVGTGHRFGLGVSYSNDGPNLLGTGGALAKSLPLLGDQFFVLYGDSFLPVNFSMVQETFRRSQRPALMTIFKNQNLWDRSNVLFIDGQIIEYNKQSPRFDMQHIDYGLGIFSAKVLEDFSQDRPFDLSGIYKDLSLKGQLAGLEVYERFYEIGSYAGLKETEEYFLAKERA